MSSLACAWLHWTSDINLEDYWQNVFVIISSASTLIGSYLLAIKPLINKIKVNIERAESEWRRKQETEEFKKAKENEENAKKLVDEAEDFLKESKMKAEQIKQEALNLLPERQLEKFIEQRIQSSDYRSQLGLISLARRDFQELSNIFTNIEEWKKNDVIKELNMTEIEKLNNSIDRIVLFIDDLDRCQSEKVVDVLQAIHLLLAFPLFVVVVGVDQRCLKQSLQMQFKGLLVPEFESEEKSGQNDANATEALTSNYSNEETPATSLDYLEKIFHIPFHLPPMDESGFGNLIEKLSEPSKAEQKQKVELPVVSKAEDVSSNKEDHIETIYKELPSSYKETKPSVIPAANDNNTSTKTELGADVDANNIILSSVKVVGSVPLERWERDALKKYHKLIRTPRGTIRLLNTYRLVRAGIPKEEGDTTFCGDTKESGEFRLAMLLLALAAGHPAIARKYFNILKEESKNPTELLASDDVPLSLKDVPPSKKAWSEFIAVYNETCREIKTPLTNDLLKKWIDRVERFTF